MCFKGVRQFQNSEVMDQQEPFCVCIYYGITDVGIERSGCGGGFVCNGHNRVKGHVWGRGGTAIMKIIPGLTGQVVGGGSYVMDTME